MNSTSFFSFQDGYTGRDLVFDWSDDAAVAHESLKEQLGGYELTLRSNEEKTTCIKVIGELECMMSRVCRNQTNDSSQ